MYFFLCHESLNILVFIDSESPSGEDLVKTCISFVTPDDESLNILIFISVEKKRIKDKKVRVESSNSMREKFSCC